MAGRTTALFARLDAREWPLCVGCNRMARRSVPRKTLIAASRLGDGLVWYVLMALLPLVVGWNALSVSLQMGTTGAVGVLLYRRVKERALRERPCARHGEIDLGVAPLDRLSFPSGHTLHAVAFTLIACSHYAWLAWPLVPLAALIALSRVALGLHYPSDVLAGAVLGALLAWTSLALGPLLGV